MRANHRSDARLHHYGSGILLDKHVNHLAQVLGSIRASSYDRLTPIDIHTAGAGLHNLLHGLLTAAGHTAHGQMPLQVKRDQGLHVKLGTQVRTHGGKTPTPGQAVKIINHKQTVHVELSLLRPLGQLGGAQATLPLTQGLIDQQPLGNGGKTSVHQMQLCLGVLLPHLIRNQLGGGKGTAQTRREGQIYRGHPGLGSPGEGLLQDRNGHLSRGRLTALTDALVEILRRKRSKHVVKMLLLPKHVGELNQRDPLPLNNRPGQIAAGIKNQVALHGHGRYSFQKNDV